MGVDRFGNCRGLAARGNQKQMQSRQLGAGRSYGGKLPPRVIDSRTVNDLCLGPSCSARALRIQVNCLSIDPVFISICREFMCELSEKEHDEIEVERAGGS